MRQQNKIITSMKMTGDNLDESDESPSDNVHRGDLKTSFCQRFRRIEAGYCIARQRTSVFTEQTNIKQRISVLELFLH